MSGFDDALSVIDSVISDEPAPNCQQCGRPHGDSPSGDFCSENCQRVWRGRHIAAKPAEDGGAHPSELPEAAPVTPLTWLGPAPAEAFAKPGHEVLDAVVTFVSRFSAFANEHAAPTLALWYAHTHVAERLYVTPRLILDSAEPGSGKTRVLEVAQYLVAKPEMTISITPAAIFRMLADGPMTLLFDEIDAVFNPKTGGNNEDLRALLNAGYKRSATVTRCVGDAKSMNVTRFPVYAPVALAGIAGGMPDTITTRAITVHMRKRRFDEAVEEFIEEDVEREAAPVRTELEAWISRVGDEVSRARPDRPEGVRDRAAEIWRPLLAIADAAGGHWPQTARRACHHFVIEATAQPASTGVRLLADIRQIFTEQKADRMVTAELIRELHAIEDGPWTDLQGKPLDSRRLAKELDRYLVRPKDLKVSGKTLKGYRIDGDGGLADAWSRYLPPPETDATSATSATPQVNATSATAEPPNSAATSATGVAEGRGTQQPLAPVLTSPVAEVADVAPAKPNHATEGER
ncbi:DUF3631 domain-containing protein [Amycolatopsis sp. FBCC-B4732]|uniref:DUF3631 domain-containing protein n=1 Tax=Amycolatopsis sp. FBCC-B4732 TaxID=3079339 RepID=UPI001FF10878|nr:DUF3631 domain-containing protein [Amycolatopsis sp. FBCC-B4732]UOX87213.1 DUF3631 domain-containing protein [Amycolatopsis sp. FBCC-B4732]